LGVHERAALGKHDVIQDLTEIDMSASREAGYREQPQVKLTDSSFYIFEAAS
jgi:hypothetical protein